jgi:UDP-glucose 4-epimerase
MRRKLWWKNYFMKILIIGGCGYIGSALWMHLNTKYDIDIVDIETFGKNISSETNKINFEHLTTQELNRYDVIIFLAGYSNVQMATNRPTAAFDTNIKGFYDLINKINDNIKFIYASSSSVYNGTIGLASENYNNYVVTNMYDFTKFAEDCLAILSNKNFYSLRLGTVCGYSPNLRTDVMINKMVLTSLSEKQIKLYNSHVYRPILGMNDLCNAIETIIEHSDRSGIYNLASINSKIIDIATDVASITNVPVLSLGITPTYNFQMSCEKFINTFDFQFTSTIKNITNNILINWNDCIKGTRQ